MPRAAELLGEGGPLAGLRPLLPAVCHMAVCEASAAVVPGAPAAAGQADEDGWGEAALVAALTAVSSVCPTTCCLAHRSIVEVGVIKYAGCNMRTMPFRVQVLRSVELGIFTLAADRDGADGGSQALSLLQRTLSEVQTHTMIIQLGNASAFTTYHLHGSSVHSGAGEACLDVSVCSPANK